MIIPPSLKANDRIRIVSPAGKINKQTVFPGIELLKEEGYEVILGKHVSGENFQFAGTDEQRLADLQEAFDDKGCKAIVCARGGYGAVRLLEKLDLTTFKKHPKWLVGFSDITVLHCLVQKVGVASIHGAMPGFYLKDGETTESFRRLLEVLKGEKHTVEIEPNQFSRNGNSTAQLVGGNLSIIYSLLGTPYEIDTDGKILFIEDLSEYLYHLDRIMHSLRLAGKLKNLAGLLVGSFSDMKDNDSPFGQSVEEIIFNAVNDYNFPACFGFPAGHTERNLPLVLGGIYDLNVAEKTSLILK